MCCIGAHLLHIVDSEQGVSDEQGLDGPQFMGCMHMAWPVEGSGGVLPHHVVESLERLDLLGRFGVLYSTASWTSCDGVLYSNLPSHGAVLLQQRLRLNLTGEASWGGVSTAAQEASAHGMVPFSNTGSPSSGDCVVAFASETQACRVV